MAWAIGAAAFVALIALILQPAVAHAQSNDEASRGAATTQNEASVDRAVTLAADGSSAAIEGCPFALEDFSRSQVGSNSEFDGEYQGYHYFVSDRPQSLSVVVTSELVVVYIPQEIANAVGFDVESEQSQADLKRLLIALDVENSKGGSALEAEGTWLFTSDLSVAQNGVVFKFDQELTPGEFYVSVIGEDGSDVTNPDNPFFTQLSHADFAQFVSSNMVEVVGAPTGIAAFGAFLQSIDFSPLWVTLKTTGVAIIFIFILGLAAAYFSLRIPARAQDIADSIFTIPMVLPPTVCGFLLLLAFGKNTPVGQWFIDIGFPLIFSWQATVLAAVVVAFPLMYRSARGAFENLDPNMMDAARTLGWSNAKIFFKLMLPLSWSSIAAGTVLSFARALGEFGATLFLAGNYLGITRTVPIAIYFEWMNGNTEVAIFWTIVIMLFSFVVILFINLWGRRTTKYRRGVGS